MSLIHEQIVRDLEVTGTITTQNGTVVLPFEGKQSAALNNIYEIKGSKVTKVNENIEVKGKKDITSILVALDLLEGKNEQ